MSRPTLTLQQDDLSLTLGFRNWCRPNELCIYIGFFKRNGINLMNVIHPVWLYRDDPLDVQNMTHCKESQAILASLLFKHRKCHFLFINDLAWAIAALKSIDSILVFKVNCTSTFINTILITFICIIYRVIHAVTYGCRFDHAMM